MAELKSLGRYTIERVLGKGAMGVVYEAIDPRLNRRVAIKTILRSSLDETTAKHFGARFVQEAQAVARLNHPHIVQVHDFGEEGDIAYIVMEFIRGKELKAFFDANERFDLKEAVRIMGELCEALDFAHQAGIVHRDVKPGNVMLDSQSRTKLTDFGVARVQDITRTHQTQEGTMVGTPAYMSPEQITGAKLDRRTDVFSAGIILYQFLTGDLPFSGGPWTIAKQIMQDATPLPSSRNTSITPLFDAVVHKALAKNPDERYQSAKQFSIALKRALEGKPSTDGSDETVLSPAAMRPTSAPAVPAPARPARADSHPGSQDAEVEFWRSIKDGNDAEDFELYVEEFPTGIYAKLARRKIAKLRGGAAEDTGPRAKEQEEAEKREQEEAARREAQVKAKHDAEDKARREIQARQEAVLAKREAELRKREAAGPRKPTPILPMIIAGVVVAAIAGGAWFALRPDTSGDSKRVAELVAQLAEAKKREAELMKSKEREVELQREAELARQREAEAKKSGDVARQKELAEQTRQREAEAQKQAELNKRREAELAQLQADQKRQAEALKQREAEQARQAARAAAEKAAAAKAAAEESAVAARAAAEKAAASKAKAEQARAVVPVPAPASPSAAGSRLPAVGDRFTYQYVDLDRRDEPKQTHSVTVTSASADVIEEEVVARGTRLQWKHGKGNYLVNLGAIVFSPYLTAFGTLSPASVLAPIRSYDNSTCRIGWTCALEARVLGNERVQVPAGAFDATKVEFRQTWSGSQTDVSSWVLTVWYSPETRRAVKFASREKVGRNGGITGNFDLELASYSRGGVAASRLPAVGDRFTYQLTDRDSRDNPKRTYVATVTTSSPGLILEDIAMPGARANLQGRHTKDNYVINLGVSVFSPFLSAFHTLEPGNALGSITNFDNASCEMGSSCTVDARVIGRERIQVPAGSFDAVKVELQQSWFGSGTIHASTGRRVLTIWYSTVTKRALKFSNRETVSRGYGLTGNFDLELTSYQLK